MTALFALSAFALLLFFTGGLYIIVPSSRPAQTVGRHRK